MPMSSGSDGEPQSGPKEPTTASTQGSGGTIWARVMGPEPDLARLKEDERASIDEEADAAPDDDDQE